MKKVSLILSLFAALLMPGMLFADGAALYKSKGCMVCHGGKGEKKQGAIPRVAGLPAEKLATALKGYRDGTIKTPMAKMMRNKKVQSLTDQEIEQIAAWLSKQ